jgi:hypothetical protein
VLGPARETTSPRFTGDVLIRHLRATRAVLVNEDHGLDAIAEVELHKDPRDVGPDCGFLDDKAWRYSPYWTAPGAMRSSVTRSRAVSWATADHDHGACTKPG